jgi:hypothetical protein
MRLSILIVGLVLLSSQTAFTQHQPVEGGSSGAGGNPSPGAGSTGSGYSGEHSGGYPSAGNSGSASPGGHTGGASPGNPSSGESGGRSNSSGASVPGHSNTNGGIAHPARDIECGCE